MNAMNDAKRKRQRRRANNAQGYSHVSLIAAIDFSCLCCEIKSSYILENGTTNYEIRRVCQGTEKLYGGGNTAHYELHRTQVFQHYFSPAFEKYRSVSFCVHHFSFLSQWISLCFVFIKCPKNCSTFTNTTGCEI